MPRLFAGGGIGHREQMTSERIDVISRRPHPIRWLILCGVLLIAVITVGTAILVDNFRNRTLLESKRELKNIALILAEQIERSFQALELV